MKTTNMKTMTTIKMSRALEACGIDFSSSEAPIVFQKTLKQRTEFSKCSHFTKIPGF
jgi:hypothetical protein